MALAEQNPSRLDLAQVTRRRSWPSRFQAASHFWNIILRETVSMRRNSGATPDVACHWIEAGQGDYQVCRFAHAPICACRILSRARDFITADRRAFDCIFRPPRFRAQFSATRWIHEKSRKSQQTPETRRSRPFSKSVQSSQLNILFEGGLCYGTTVLARYVSNLGLDSAKFSRGLVAKPKKRLQVARKQFAALVALRPPMGACDLLQRHWPCGNSTALAKSRAGSDSTVGAFRALEAGSREAGLNSFLPGRMMSRQ